MLLGDEVRCESVEVEGERNRAIAAEGNDSSCAGMHGAMEATSAVTASWRGLLLAWAGGRAGESTQLAMT